MITKIRQIMAYPFFYLSTLLVGVGLLIQYGLSKSIKILRDFADLLNELKGRHDY
jgi:hypothetical protein